MARLNRTAGARLDKPPSLTTLRTLVAQRLPRVELPQLLLEVQTWTGLASDFTHVNEHGARADDLPIGVCAVLLVEACNLGLEPLVRPEIPALTGAPLAWIQHNYLCPDTITNANATLVDVHAALPLTSFWVALNWPQPTAFASPCRSGRSMLLLMQSTSAEAKA